MELHVKVRKVGNSFIVTIPDQIVKDMKLKLGDAMCMDLIEKKIVIRKCET